MRIRILYLLPLLFASALVLPGCRSDLEDDLEDVGDEIEDVFD